MEMKVTQGATLDHK